jgi:hypothetical protein
VKAFEMELANWFSVNQFFHGAEQPLGDQNLTRLSLTA